MLGELLEDVFSRHSTIADRLMGLLIFVAMTAFAGLLSLFAYVVVDQVPASHRTAAVSIESKEIVPPHTSQGLLLAGKVIFPQTRHHPESYRIHVTIEGKGTHISVDKNFFDSVMTGEIRTVSYGYCRLSGTLEVISVQ